MTMKSRLTLIFALIVVVGLSVLVVVGIAVAVWISRFTSGIDAAEWKEVISKEDGFQALMPGTPRLEQQTQESPAGNMEMHKFSVQPKDKKELFMVVSFRFSGVVSRNLGGKEKLLELGRQDILKASQGQIKSEKRIDLNGCPGLEIEVLPLKGAIVKARIFATENRLFEVCVHVPQFRLESQDIQKFLDSFQLMAEPGAAADRPRERRF
jgi:hypothetical protein